MRKQFKEVSFPVEVIQDKIYLIRGQKVILDRDLAQLYGVTTGNLNKAVKRNLDRFPEDFMFQLTIEEANASRFQIGTLKKGENIKYLPYAFTEQGVAMLSSVLRSKNAVQVNIQIMRVFTKLRQIMLTHKDLAQKIEELEKKYDGQFRAVFTAIRQLMIYPDDGYKRSKAGFIADK